MGEMLSIESEHGNPLTVLRVQDLRLASTPKVLVVDLMGLDVDNPMTGEVVPGDADQITMRMPNTDYDEESFFVRPPYFPSQHDPYCRLKHALKSDIHEEAWPSLDALRSSPFPTPRTGKVAMIVVNDNGDEIVWVLAARACPNTYSGNLT